MNSRNGKHLSREKLLELLMERTKQVNELEDQLKQAESEVARLKEANESLEKEPGSIAQAALSLNRVFEDAQKAADQYLAAIAHRQQEQEQICQQTLADAQHEADRLVSSARQRAEELEAETARNCEELRTLARQAATENWAEILQKLDHLSVISSETQRLLGSQQAKRRWRR